MKTSSKSGLTLIELLLAAVLASIVISTAATMLISAFRENTRQNTMMVRQAETDWTFGLLREKIRNGSNDGISSLGGGQGIRIRSAGETNSFFKQDNSLRYIRESTNSVDILLIDDGLDSFSFYPTSNALMVIEAGIYLTANKANPVPYVLKVFPRN